MLALGDPLVLSESVGGVDKVTLWQCGPVRVKYKYTSKINYIGSVKRGVKKDWTHHMIYLQVDKE